MPARFGENYFKRPPLNRQDFKQFGKKGFIIRVADTKNNRLIRKIILTDSGKQTLSLITSKIKEYLQKIPQVLSYERIDDLKKSMSEFREILKQEVELNI